MDRDPRSTILYAATGTALIITADALLVGGSVPTARSYFGLLVALILALLLAGFVPAIAAGLMLLMFVAVLLKRGGKVFKALT